MLSVALLGFQYVFNMHCLMLIIEAILISIDSLLSSVPLNWISSTKISLHPQM